MTIGQRIKERRIELGMSVDELAELIGKNRATIYRYENNNIENLPSPVLKDLADALKTTPEYLIDWNENEKNEKNNKNNLKKAPTEKGKSNLSDILKVFSTDEVEQLSALSRDVTEQNHRAHKKHYMKAQEF